MANPKVERAVKALLLIGLGFFLYSRIANGTLYYYISERYAWLTALAFVGFLIVGLSYRSNQAVHEHHDHGDDHRHDDHHAHSHGLTWGGAILVLLPILLGLLVPPQPLGASALSNREINTGSADSVLPAVVRKVAEKAAADRNILDWVTAFRAAKTSGEQFAGVEANVIGIVYRTETQPEGTFWAARFVVGCCVADASPAALLVRWPQSADLADGTWVQVAGTLDEEAGQGAPILIARSVDEVAAPNQPYLYP